MQLDIQKRLAPLAEKFVKDLTALVEKRVDEVIAQASRSFETALASAIDNSQAEANATPAATAPRKTPPRATVIQGKRVAKPAARDRTAPQINGKLDVNPLTGSIKFNFPSVEPEDLVESCSLDIADRGGQTLEDVGNLMNITRERARQLETNAKFAARAAASGLEP